MYLKSRLVYFYVETPLHAGAGSGVEAVDLPIQRERTTDYPMVQAPGIKGALRSEAPANKQDEVRVIFGPDPDEANQGTRHAGAFAPGDARILLFPVRSLKGVFAWTTSLDVLQRWYREAVAAGIHDLPSLPDTEPPVTADMTGCYTSGKGNVVNGRVVLEEFTYQVQSENATQKLAGWLAAHALPPGEDYDWWKKELKKKLVVLPNDDFRDFTRQATQVLTRIRLEPDSKTVAPGALWTEEHLPPDTLLFAPARATRFRLTRDAMQGMAVPKEWHTMMREGQAVDQATTVLDWVSNAENIPHRLQLGGDETVGRGIISLRWS